jgi:hypothetical protein
MNVVAYLALAALLVTAADVPPETRPPAELPPSQILLLLTDATTQAAPPTQQQQSKKAQTLQPYSRIALVRFINGEFAKAVRPLPAVKPGFRIKPGEPVNEQGLKNALMRGGSAANPGDSVQVTRLVFKEKEIYVDINGGSKKGGKRWRDRIQVSVTGIPQTRVEQVGGTGPGGGAVGFSERGATLILDFGGPLPDMTPDEFKQYVSQFLDFSKQRSAAVQWVETLPPEFQQAIKEKQAMVGMDREMVVAALGKPERKIRERDAEGNETEDWIYGHPPGRTIFVKFIGDKVIAVRQFP